MYVSPRLYDYMYKYELHNHGLHHINLATGGADYQDFIATLTFPTGSGSGARECTDVQILDDDIVEANQIFNLTASIITPFPGASLNVSMGTVTIIDEDGTYKCAHLHTHTKYNHRPSYSQFNQI